jgi:N utilization substance protein A
MFDLKVIHSVLDQLEEERGIPKARIIEAIELALATAYKKEYGRRGQYIRATFDIANGDTHFYQVKTAVDPDQIVYEKEAGEEIPEDKVFFNDEQHILIDDARKIKKDIQVGEELIFPLEAKEDYGRIAAQTAKQVIIQKIREAEKVSVLGEFGKKEGEIVSGTVERIERGNVYVTMGRALGLLPYEEQIPGEHFKQGERVRACLVRVDETPRGIYLRLSRANPKFLHELFKAEVPEVAAGTVELKSIAREAGARSKVAVFAADSHIDPVGSMVGQRGVRVNTVSSEIGGEKIDIVEWNEDPAKYIEESLKPARAISVKTNPTDNTAIVEVAEDQQSLAIGKGGQNVRLAAKLTGWRIDIRSVKGDVLADADENDSKIRGERDGFVIDEKNFRDISNLDIKDDVAPEFRDKE